MNAKHSSAFGRPNSSEFTSSTSNPGSPTVSPSTRCRPAADDLAEFNVPLKRALNLLYSASCYADACQRARWDFAVEMAEIQRLGASTAELRWLMVQGLAEHAIETSAVCQSHRTFRDKQGFRFTTDSCFVLTQQGVAIARNISNAMMSSENNSLIGATPPEAIQPNWDCVRHELRMGSRLVKRFKWRAQNQEALLTAFEEENWPVRIDDPLPPVFGKNPKRRLSDTIKCLNRNQIRPLIRFTGDGTGEGILWEAVSFDDHAHASTT